MTAEAPVEAKSWKRRAVIFDSDIGDCIDDVWALALLLRCPEIDVRLLVTTAGNAEQHRSRARVMAKILDAADSSHIPIGLGNPGQKVTSEHVGSYFEWAADYDIDNYPGGILDNGVRRMIQIAETEDVTVLALGSATNIAAAAESGGEVFTQRVQVIGQFARFNGAIGGYNVNLDLLAFEQFLATPFATMPIIVSFGVINEVMFSGGCRNREMIRSLYHRLRQSQSPLMKAVFDCDELYHKRELVSGPEWYPESRPEGISDPSNNGDAVMVWLAAKMFRGIELAEQEEVLSEFPESGSGNSTHSGVEVANQTVNCDKPQRLVCVCRAWKEADAAREMFWYELVSLLDSGALADTTC